MSIECRNCRFFRGDNAVMGACRRFPQSVNKFPADWCGEFQQLEVTMLPIGQIQPAPRGRPKKVNNDPTAS
jgi:hypothetical protein